MSDEQSDKPETPVVLANTITSRLRSWRSLAARRGRV